MYEISNPNLLMRIMELVKLVMFEMFFFVSIVFMLRDIKFVSFNLHCIWLVGLLFRV